MAIVLRTVTGSALTYQQVDTNFSSLIHSGSVSGNILTLHYSSSAFSPSNLIIPITSASFATTASMTTAITGSNRFIPVFTGIRTLGSSAIYQVDAENIAIGTTTPEESALFELKSTRKGFLPPRVSTSQMNEIVNPTPGLIVYDTDAHRIYVFSDGSWRGLAFT
jgi:hypothetical protein